jgi:hypothetical protein
MKTLREYIDQLDEISRRDFLKGAGATAGLAAVGAPKDASAQTLPKEVSEPLSLICTLYMACKEPYQNAEATKGRTVEISPEVCQKTKQLIQKFIRGYPNGRDIVQGVYNGIYNVITQAESAKPFRGSVLNRMYFDQSFQQKALKDFGSLVEFIVGSGTPPTDQQLASVRQAMTMEEESLEETSEDPIAKIDALFKDKK